MHALVAAGSTLWIVSSLATAQDPAERLLASLSLEQKAGQLFTSWSLSRLQGTGEASNHAKLLAWVRDVGLGGVILSLGTVDDAAVLVPRLQAAAEVPLLLAGDFEGGVWFRLRGATELGNQMLVGATGSQALAEAMGRVTAQEAKALGFQWVYAPVLDVNSNPDNPIINVRSFGEDPALVARLGCAFARGVRSEGLLPCGKHFPGHGDVDSDSHLALPTVPGDRARLHSVELVPFAAAAREGLESVMTGHLAVPGLGEDPSLPATLSAKILGGVLRGELGFTGLVVTDALEMGGVKNAFPPGEVAVRALLAGADVLLMPPDPLAARGAVVEAVRAGRVPAARLDDAVLRILRMKARVGLLAGGGGVAPDWRTKLRTPEAERLADTIAGRGLVLVRDRAGVLPLQPDEAHGGAVVVTLLDDKDGAGDDTPGRTFADSMHRGLATTGDARLSPASSAVDVAAAVQRVRTANTVVLALHVRVRAFAGRIGVPPELRPVLDALRDGQQVVVVSFGNPYLVREIPAATVYVCAFLGTERVERAAAAALLGAAPLFGRLPVTIPGVAPAGTGCTVLPGRDVARAEPADQDLDAALPARLRTVLEAAVADRAFPGAVCLVARRGAIVAEVAVGRLGYAPDEPAVTPGTLYDLASLTKVCATTPAILRLVALGRLSLDDPVQKWVPAFQGTGKERVTVRHLLAHSGGLPAYERYYRTLHGKDAIVAAAAAEGLMTEPGTSVTYSDLGFVLLMAVVEAASGEPFGPFVQREVFDAFGMRSARFVPTDGPAADAAPTEQDAQRGGIVRGYVHDENAFAMGGISGHAGLFATAEDVMRYGIAMLAGGRGVLPRPLVAEATRPVGFGGDTTRGLGFQLLASGGYGGTSVPPDTFGHTGFTGTSLWCDPRHDLCCVLLTNRVHPTRVNNKITGVRRAVHDLVLDSLR
ncbi:MAG TPA: glycoside hydrolase family 3 N-terminal domain-containing protein [Planctomycetota bacterium]|nr:glycoside hydrolase family 3 N-terminal domain-containing protein [Planctomycetota bacterium]